MGIPSAYDALFSRNIGIYTQEVQEALRLATAAIAGVGGPGGALAVTLARNGIGHLKIADPDIFEVHNINRQYGAGMHTIGKRKVDVLEQILLDINPHLQVTTYSEGITKKTISDFLDAADVVIDAIDYNAPEEKKRLYVEARNRGFYVLSSPIGGLGALIMCFDPDGVHVEEVFGFPDDEKKIAGHAIPIKRLIGHDLDYVSPDYFHTMQQNPPYISTNASAAMLSAGLVSVEVLKIILLRRRESNPAAFSYLRDIPLITMPYARRIDLWDHKNDGIINVLEIKNG